jgi:hypothetical protein
MNLIRLRKNPYALEMKDGDRVIDHLNTLILM